MFSLTQPLAGTYTAPVASGGGATTAITLIYDTFTDTNGTAIASHTIAPTNTPSATWANSAAGWQIQSNKLKLVSGGDVWCYVNAGVADCTIEADLTTATTGDSYLGIVLRYTNTSNFWNVQARIDGGGNRWLITEIASGSATTRATGGTTANATTYQVKIVLSGTTITLYVNGVLTASYASATSNQTATRFGAYNNSSFATPTLDNFKVSVP